MPNSNYVRSKYVISNYISYNAFALAHQHFLSNLALIKEPTSYNQAKKDPNWQESINKEIQALEANQT